MYRDGDFNTTAACIVHRILGKRKIYILIISSEKLIFFFLNREDLEISITSPLLSFVDLIYRSVRQVDLFGLNNFSDLNLYKFYIEFLSDLYMDGIYKYFFVSCFD